MSHAQPECEMAPLVSKKASVFVLHILKNMPTYVGSKYVLRLGTKVSTELIASLFVFVLNSIHLSFFLSLPFPCLTQVLTPDTP